MKKPTQLVIKLDESDVTRICGVIESGLAYVAMSIVAASNDSGDRLPTHAAGDVADLAGCFLRKIAGEK